LYLAIFPNPLHLKILYS